MGQSTSVSSNLGYQHDLYLLIDSMNIISKNIKKNKKIYPTSFNYSIYYYNLSRINKIYYKLTNNNKNITIDKNPNGGYIFSKYHNFLYQYKSYDFIKNNEDVLFMYKIDDLKYCVIHILYSDINSLDYEITPMASKSVSIGNLNLFIESLYSNLKFKK
jgi:hypothetical protein